MKHIIAIVILPGMFAVPAFGADLCGDEGRTFIPLDLPVIENGTSSIMDSSGQTRAEPVGQPAEPMYLRVHPSGKYVIFSLENGKAMIADISNPDSPKLIEGPLMNEAAAVEPNWDYISSPYAATGMEYFKFDQLVKPEAGKDVKPAFSDYRHNQYYQSSAELPGSKAGQRKFRTLLYMTLSARDYTVTEKPNGQASATLGKLMYVCESVKENLMQPMLSKDGRYLAALSMPPAAMEMVSSINSGSTSTADSSSTVNSIMATSGTKIFSVDNNGQCKEVANLGYGTGKATFAYPNGSGIPRFSFTNDQTFQDMAGNSGTKEAVYIHDPKGKTTVMLSQPWLEERAQTPGFTKDGKVIYISKRDGKSGLVIVDPKKVPVPTEAQIKSENGPYAVCFNEGWNKPSNERRVYPTIPPRSDTPGSGSTQ